MLKHAYHVSGFWKPSHFKLFSKDNVVVQNTPMFTIHLIKCRFINRALKT